MRKTPSYIFYLPLAGLLLFFVVAAIDYPLSDFAGYYFGSKLLLKGEFKSVYDTYSLNSWISEHGYKGLFVSYTPFPPSTSIIFSPFLMTDVSAAKTIFNLFSVLAFVVSLYRLVKFSKFPHWVALLIPVVFFTAIRNNIMFGQAYFFLFCLLVEGYLAHVKKRYWLSSVYWSIAVLLKTFPVLLLLYLLFQKRYRSAFYLSIACVLLLCLSILVNGFDVWRFYLGEIFPRINKGELNSSFAWQFQSAFMLLKNIFIYDPLLNPTASAHLPIVFFLLLLLFKAFIVGISASISVQQDKRFASFACWIMASILISPNGSTYSLILFLFPLLALYAETRFTGTTLLVLATILLFIAINIPIQWFSNLPDVMQYPRLYLLILFFISFVLLCGATIRYKWIILFGLLFSISDRSILHSDQDDSSYLLAEHRHGLIFRYEIINKELVYHYWNNSGDQSYNTAIPVESSDVKQVSIKNNQVWYRDRQLTNSSDNKLQPLIINRQYIVYLSDKFKGIGFYTIRKIPVPATK